MDKKITVKFTGGREGELFSLLSLVLFCCSGRCWDWGMRVEGMEGGRESRHSANVAGRLGEKSTNTAVQ
jgi:hypothetical protein